MRPSRACALQEENGHASALLGTCSTSFNTTKVATIECEGKQTWIPVSVQWCGRPTCASSTTKLPPLDPRRISPCFPTSGQPTARPSKSCRRSRKSLAEARSSLTLRASDCARATAHRSEPRKWQSIQLLPSFAASALQTNAAVGLRARISLMRGCWVCQRRNRFPPWRGWLAPHHRPP